MIIFGDKWYNRLKYFTQIVLPALGTLYFALAGIWDLPKAEEVVGTVVAVDLFLGTLLQLSSTAYAKSDARFDGSIDVLNAEDGIQNFSMNLPADARAIVDADQVLLKVNKSPSTSKGRLRRTK